MEIMRRALNGMRAEEAVESILNMFSNTKNNNELIEMVKRKKYYRQAGNRVVQ